MGMFLYIIQIYMCRSHMFTTYAYIFVIALIEKNHSGKIEKTKRVGRKGGKRKEGEKRERGRERVTLLSAGSCPTFLQWLGLCPADMTGRDLTHSCCFLVPRRVCINLQEEWRAEQELEPWYSDVGKCTS